MLIKNGLLVKLDSATNGDLRILDGKIAEIGENLIPASGEEVFDAKGSLVTPGFVDIHTHGGYASDFMDCTKGAFEKALTFHLDNGTTSVVVTSCTAPKPQIINFLEFSKEYMKSGQGVGAQVVGVHLEGPYLSVKNRGAQKLEELAVPSCDDYSYMFDYADIIKTVTISPELDGAEQMTKALTERGIMVSGGHDDGIYPKFMPAIENGLRHVTHLYCATSELRFEDGVRNVGFREYALIDDRLTVELIADNKHIPPELARMIIRAKGVDKVCVVSDCLSCAGIPVDGTIYKLGTGDNAQLVVVNDGVATLAETGRYAGSITCVRKMVKNLIDAGIPLCDAVKAGTINPAKVIGEDARVGSLEVGKDANICVLNANFELEKVFLNGLEK
ncbi:MAG: N-acetylglucosamine-6-phosphate deacetylase [Clostridia bacterium]|nr:N-acetylglucosamine-6-phosphate deacetylase [Clostridia bacterium]